MVAWLKWPSLQKSLLTQNYHILTDFLKSCFFICLYLSLLSKKNQCKGDPSGQVVHGLNPAHDDKFLNIGTLKHGFFELEVL